MKYDTEGKQVVEQASEPVRWVIYSASLTLPYDAEVAKDWCKNPQVSVCHLPSSENLMGAAGPESRLFFYEA